MISNLLAMGILQAIHARGGRRRVSSSRDGPKRALGRSRSPRESRLLAATTRPIVVAGARELVPLLAKELRAGGEPRPSASTGRLEGARARLDRRGRTMPCCAGPRLARVPIVGLTDGASLPYVLDTDLVRVPAGQGFPVEEIAEAVAHAVGDRGPASLRGCRSCASGRRRADPLASRGGTR